MFKIWSVDWYWRVLSLGLSKKCFFHKKKILSASKTIEVSKTVYMSSFRNFIFFSTKFGHYVQFVVVYHLQEKKIEKQKKVSIVLRFSLLFLSKTTIKPEMMSKWLEIYNICLFYGYLSISNIKLSFLIKFDKFHCSFLFPLF